MRVLQMPALGITRAAHSAVIKTPDFPQDSSPRFVDEKVTHMSKISPPLHLGRKTIFLDRLNETMTAVSSEEREGRKTDGKKAKGERKIKGRGGGRAVSLVHIFLFLSLSPNVAASNANPAFKSRRKH